MYSVVLAAMMSTSSVAPDTWWRCCPPPRIHHACCGGCYGGYGYVAYRPTLYVPYASCYGYPVVASSCGGCYGYSTMTIAPPMAQPTKPMAQPLPAPKPSSSLNSNKATVVFKAPLDIKISIEGNVISRTNEEEAFVTPELENGKSYIYNVSATRNEEGKEVSFSKKVSIKSGTSVVVEFEEFTVTTVAK